MKAILLLFLLAVSQYASATSCDIEKGYYLITKPEQLKVKVKSCDPVAGWGQDRDHFATFNEVDLSRARRELLTKHRLMISSRCKLLGTGDIEVVTKPSHCAFTGVDESMASFTVKYKCHLF